MLHRTIKHRTVVPLYQSSKTYHPYQFVPNPFHHPTLPFWSRIVPFSFIYYRCTFSFCNKVFQTFKKRQFIPKNIDHPQKWAVRGSRSSIPVFGRGNLQRSSWFENYLSIGPFWWINFNCLRSCRDRFGYHNLRLAVVGDFKNIIHVTFSDVDVWTLTLSPASSWYKLWPLRNTSCRSSSP